MITSKDTRFARLWIEELGSYIHAPYIVPVRSTTAERVDVVLKLAMLYPHVVGGLVDASTRPPAINRLSRTFVVLS